MKIYLIYVPSYSSQPYFDTILFALHLPPLLFLHPLSFTNPHPIPRFPNSVSIKINFHKWNEMSLLREEETFVKSVANIENDIKRYADVSGDDILQKVVRTLSRSLERRHVP